MLVAREDTVTIVIVVAGHEHDEVPASVFDCDLRRQAQVASLDPMVEVVVNVQGKPGVPGVVAKSDALVKVVKPVACLFAFGSTDGIHVVKAVGAVLSRC